MTDIIKKELAVTPAYCKKVLSKVDKIVQENFFDSETANEVWVKALAEKKSRIVASKDLLDLSYNINELIKVLKTSHCGLYTHNDETFYFLRSLFGTRGARLKQPAYDFTGFAVGGGKCLPNQIRYVLDGSPAAEAGLMIGDTILKVNGRPFIGQANFFGTAGTAVILAVKRGSQSLIRYMTPAFKTPREGYTEAIMKSVRVMEYSDCNLGYVHIWSGIGESEEAFRWAVFQWLAETDGLIIDLRDGYGGLGITAIDWLYRPESGMKVITSHSKGKPWGSWSVRYDRPVIALINGGSRSGKELVALQLKKTKRATLLGEKTAGAMVAGSHFPIDKRLSMYVAVVDTLVDGERIEGVGVAPDIVVPFDYDKPGIDSQLDAAAEMLRRKIAMNKHKRS